MSWTKFRYAGYLAAASTAVCACSLIFSPDKEQCATTADCVAKGPAFVGLVCGPQGVCVKEGCSNNKECIDANGGQPSICRKETRSCVGLVTTVESKGVACAPIADSDFTNDETVWIGLNLTKSATLPYGVNQVNLSEFAAKEINTLGGGLPPAVAGAGKSRPLGLLFCDNENDLGKAVAASTYLTEEVGVPALVLPDSPALVIPSVQPALAAKTFVTGSMVADLAFLDTSSPRHFFPGSASVTVEPASLLADLVQSKLEPTIRQELAMAPTDQVKVALLVNQNQLEVLLANNFTPLVKVNGKSVTDNKENFQVIPYPDVDKATPADYAVLQDKILAAKPHLILAWSLQELATQIVIPIETKWSDAVAPYRPYWLTGIPAVSADLFGAFAGGIPTQLATKRFVWFGPNWITDASKTTISSYESSYQSDPKVDPLNFGFVMLNYDIIYGLAYMVAANGANPVTGDNLSKAMAKILPPNTQKIVAGPNSLPPGFQGATGAGIDYDGRLTSFDYTPQGVVPGWAWAIYCAQTTPEGVPVGSQFSGLTFDPKTRAIIGDINCASPSAPADGGVEDAGDGG